MKLTPEQCRMLTERLLGKCWHDEWEDIRTGDFPFSGWLLVCKKCREPQSKAINRIFTTWADIEPVRKALEAKGLWGDFRRYAWMKFPDSDYLMQYDESDTNAEFESWLFGQDEDGDYRFCRLVAEFIKKKVCKDEL